ncbi:hypothetical protein RF55_9889, partial [Lasius niger]
LDPVDPFTQPYDVIVQKLEEFYEPAPLEVAENYRFYQRKQSERESVQQYVAALHKLSIHCKFGDYLKTALRNQFVFGLLNKKTQARLLEKKDLDFDEAVKIAITMELSEKSSQQMKSASSNPTGIDYLKAGKKPPRKNTSDKRSKFEARKYTAHSSNFNTNSDVKTNVKCFRCGKPLSYEIGAVVTVVSEQDIQQIVPAIKDVQAKLRLKPGATPVFVQARPVPFKLLQLVEQELDNLKSAGIIEKVTTSKWATPIVPILKRNGKIRVCGDYKVTVNPQLLVYDHPFPTIDELFSKLANGNKFSKLDLEQAYLQLEIAPEDRELLKISTCKGFYKVNRLMYGIASGPTIWQREIENILQGIPGVAIFFDDIIITGKTDAIHLSRLEELDPVDPFTQPYDVIVQKLEEFYEPAPLEVAENYRFYQRKQSERESVQQYVAALHKLSIHCKFGDYLKTALRNQFVFGLLNKKTQARLLEKKDLDFDEAVKIAITMELSEKSSQQMKSASSNPTGIDYLKAGKKPPRKNTSDKRSKFEARKYTAHSSNFNTNSDVKTNVKCFRCGKPLSYEIGAVVTVVSEQDIQQIVPAIKDVQAKLRLKPGATPVFVQARPVPFKLLQLVEQELDNLKSAGIIEKVTTSKWATPIVPILKRNGKIRVCGDYKVTVNPQLLVYDHPFPTIDELFSKLANGNKFSKLDLEQAYLQLEIAPEDRELLKISTCKGFYKVNRLITILRPLNALLRKDTPFIWSKECEAAFCQAKEAFISNRVLVYFNPRLPLVLATDVSSYGVGAVLSHRYPDGPKRMIQFALQIFSETQQTCEVEQDNIPQLENVQQPQANVQIDAPASPQEEQNREAEPI